MFALQVFRFLILLTICSGSAWSQSLPVLSVPHAPVPPRLDATPNDLAWQNAAQISVLTPSITPDAPLPTAPPTQVKVLWDKDFLYVRFIATDNDVFTPFTERDAFHYQGDVAEVFFDPVGDGRVYYELQFSPRGGILDQYIVLSADPIYNQWGRFTQDFKNRNYWANLAWNCEGLRSAAKITQTNGRDSGWIVDVALPAVTVLKRLGQTNFTPGVVRANFLRYDWPLVNEKRELHPLNWSPVLFGCPHISPGRMGFLQLKAAE